MEPLGTAVAYGCLVDIGHLFDQKKEIAVSDMNNIHAEMPE